MKLEFFDGISWYSVATESFVNAKVFDINSNTTGQLNINRLSGYPANSSVYLNGNSGWSDPLQITVNSTGYNVNVNNTNSAATFTGFAALSNGITNAQFGYNASTGTGYVWSSGALLFYTNATAQMQSSREPLYRDSLSHHRTSDVAYGGFAVMFTKS